MAWLLVVASGAAGVGLCLLGLVVLHAPWLGVRFPAPGGEDDFAVRTAALFLGVLPAFFALGGAIEFWSDRGRANRASSWCGALAGTAAAMAATYILKERIAGLHEATAGNHAVFALQAAWVALSALGAWLANAGRAT